MNSLIYTALCATVDSLIHIVNVLTASQTIIQMFKCIIKLRKSGHWKNADFNKMRGNQVWRKLKNADFRVNAEISQAWRYSNLRSHCGTVSYENYVAGRRNLYVYIIITRQANKRVFFLIFNETKSKFTSFLQEVTCNLLWNILVICWVYI